MNKFVKGSIAAAAATVLLLGGAGSLAYWNSSADLAVNTTIKTGELDLTETSAGTWSGSASGNWVPGDSATYTTELQLITDGERMKGEVSLDATSLSIPAGLADDFIVSFDKSAAFAALDKVSGTGSLAYDANSDTLSFVGTGTYKIPVTVTVTFLSSADEADSMSQALDLTRLSFIATQTAP